MEESADINCKSQVKDWLIEIEANVKPKLASECSIFRVPEDIRRMNADAYTPKVISIGPLHHGKPELADMENKKKIYVKSFLDRIPAEKKAQKEEEIITFVQNNEQLIRASYAETIKLEGSQFVKMIISDALFIIEHLLRTYYYLRDVFYSWLQVPVVVRSAISLDLQLLENQLPFFVLKEIYNLLDDEEASFLQISVFFFRYAFDLDIYDLQEEPKHFTDLIRTSLVKSCPEVELKGPIGDLPCAMKLHESGLKFKRAERSSLFDIRLDEGKTSVPFLIVKELHMPRFTIYDITEPLLRNMMALEQCYYQLDTRVCNYVRFMDYLINTEKDVELLVSTGIISYEVGSSAQIAKMINNLCVHVTPDNNSCYYEICKELKAHYENPSNKNKAALKEEYFSDPWRTTATIAAGILLLLTAIQTICSIMQVA